MIFGVDLDGDIRRVDPERWLSSRFISDLARRGDAVALYALDHELTRAETATSSALAAELRLAWWRETLAEIFAGETPRQHPVAEAVARAIRIRELPQAPFVAMIEARIACLGRQSLSPSEGAAWARRTQGNLATLVALVLGAAEASGRAEAPGTAWGLFMLCRARRASGASLDDALALARRAARGLPPSAFPAALPTTLARTGLQARRPSGLEKRLRLTWAALTGRL